MDGSPGSEMYFIQLVQPLFSKIHTLNGKHAVSLPEWSEFVEIA